MPDPRMGIRKESLSMETISIDGLTLFFKAEERDAAELIGEACQRSIRLIHQCWGLDTPKDCRVYVMTSWLHFVFHSAPWAWQVLLGASLPLWYFRVRKMWAYAGGWTQPYGQRVAVGVKPPRLIQLADRSIGARIFVREEDIDTKVRQITCHELVHAFTAHLKLPMWLNEGLAQVTVDRFAGKPAVRSETIEVLARSSGRASPGRYWRLRPGDKDALVYHYVRGYWITRYLQETRPELLQDMLSQRYRHRVLESKLATVFGMSRAEFWHKIDGIVVSHFKPEEKGMANGE